MVFKFKVGDRVIDEYEDEGTVIRVGHRIGGEKWMNYQVAYDDCGDIEFNRASDLTLIAKAEDKEEKTMSDMTNGIAAKIRHAFKSADDKILLEAGIIDEAGTTTESGRRVLSDVLFEANKAEIVERAKKVLDEAKKKK